MQIITWSDAYSVHIDEFDEQHKQLINLINALHEAMSQGRSKEMLGDALKALIDYANVHFSTEEKYLTQFGFTGLPKHKAEHEAFIRKVQDFQQQYQQGKAILSIQLMNFLKDWLTNHILNTDKQYSAFLNEHGLH